MLPRLRLPCRRPGLKEAAFVGSLFRVPGFEAYARIFHPAGRYADVDEYRAVSWAEILKHSRLEALETSLNHTIGRDLLNP